MNRPCLLALLLVLASASVAEAQELEPRRWSHLPTGTNFHSGGYAFTDGDLSLDPVLKIEDATFEMHTVALKYIRTFELLGRSARVDLAGAYQDGTWKGTLDGVPARAERNGWADPVAKHLNSRVLRGRTGARSLHQWNALDDIHVHDRIELVLDLV